MFIVFALHIRIDIKLTYDFTYQTSNSLLKTLMGKIMIRAFELFQHNITSYPKCFEFKTSCQPQMDFKVKIVIQIGGFFFL